MSQYIAKSTNIQVNLKLPSTMYRNTGTTDFHELFSSFMNESFTRAKKHFQIFFINNSDVLLKSPKSEHLHAYNPLPSLFNETQDSEAHLMSEIGVQKCVVFVLTVKIFLREESL